MNPVKWSFNAVAPLPHSGQVGFRATKDPESQLPLGFALGYEMPDGQVQWLWETCEVDCATSDLVLVYRHRTSQNLPITGDEFRFSEDGRWFLGPSVGSPKGATATGTICCCPDTPTAVRIRPWYDAKSFTGLELVKWSEKQTTWITFSREGDPGQVFHIGMAAAIGSPDDPFGISIHFGGTADNPGPRIMHLDQHGNLTISGKLISKHDPKPFHSSSSSL